MFSINHNSLPPMPPNQGMHLIIPAKRPRYKRDRAEPGHNA
jgi:hypothetical protein